MELTKGYQLEKFQCCRLSGSSFTEVSQEHIDDVIMSSFHIVGFEISIFCEMDYKLSTCQVSNPSVISIKFYKVSIRNPKKHLGCHHDVASKYLASKIAHFVELNRSY